MSRLFFAEIKQLVTSDMTLATSMERMTGVEPAYAAWEAAVLPMNYIRDCLTIIPKVGGNCNTKKVGKMTV